MRIAIVIPTIEGREESLQRCIDSYEELTPEGHEYIVRVYKGYGSSGEAWLDGLRVLHMEDLSLDYVHLTNDDIEVKNVGWLDACMEAADSGKLPCPVVWNPDATLQSAGGFMGSADNLNKALREDWFPVDFTTVPFMTWDQALKIGMIPVHYCSDVWVSYKGRQDFGIETVLRTSYELIHHNHPVGRGAGLPQDTRNTIDTQIMRKYLTGVLTPPQIDV